MLLVGRLSRGEPLQSGAFCRRLQIYRNIDDVSLGSAAGDRNVKRSAKRVAVRFQLPLGLGRVDIDALDVDESGVENDLVAPLVGLAFELQRGGALEELAIKVQLEVDSGVLGAPSRVVGQSGGIAVGHGGDCCESATEEAG